MTANEFGQYRLEVSLALTEEEGDQMLGELVGMDGAGLRKSFGMVKRILVRSMTIIGGCRQLVAVEKKPIHEFLVFVDGLKSLRD